MRIYGIGAKFYGGILQSTVIFFCSYSLPPQTLRFGRSRFPLGRPSSVMRRISEMRMKFSHCHLSSVICHLSSVICHLSSVICHLSSVICHLSSVICHLPSNLYPSILRMLGVPSSTTSSSAWAKRATLPSILSQIFMIIFTQGVDRINILCYNNFRSGCFHVPSIRFGW